MARKKTKKLEREEKRTTLKIDLRKAMKQDIIDYATEHGIPQSQLADMLLEYGFDALRNGELNLTDYIKPSHTPLCENLLNLENLSKRKKDEK